MPVKKLSAFTLMELMVSMFISILLIGMSYFLFRTIHFYFQRLDQNAELVSERQLMRLVLRKDWEEADSVVMNTEGLHFYHEQQSLQWMSSTDSLVRVTEVQRKGFRTGVAQLQTANDPKLNLVNFLALSFSDRENETFEFSKEYPLKYLVR